MAARAGAAWDKAARPAVPFFIWGPLFAEGLDPEPSAKIFFYFFYLISLPRANIQGPRQRCFLFISAGAIPFKIFAEGLYNGPSAKSFIFLFPNSLPRA